MHLIFFSGFDKASILTVDAFGEKQSTGMFYSDEKKLRKFLVKIFSFAWLFLFYFHRNMWF